MNNRKITVLLGALMLTSTWAMSAPPQKAPPPVLTAAGQKLQERYDGMLKALRQQISAAIPQVTAQKQTEYAEARKAEKAAETAFIEAQKQLGKVAGAQGLIGHAEHTACYKGLLGTGCTACLSEAFPCHQLAFKLFPLRSHFG